MSLMHWVFMPPKFVYVAPPTASSTRVLGWRALRVAMASRTVGPSIENWRPVPNRERLPLAYVQSGCANDTTTTAGQGRCGGAWWGIVWLHPSNPVACVSVAIRPASTRQAVQPRLAPCRNLRRRQAAGLTSKQRTRRVACATMCCDLEDTSANPRTIDVCGYLGQVHVGAGRGPGGRPGLVVANNEGPAGRQRVGGCGAARG